MSNAASTRESGLISPEDIAKVRTSTSIAQMLGEITFVKKMGNRFQARCPFHDDSSPSMSVDERLGLYNCFGCGASGDVVTLIQKNRNLDFRGAVEYLAERANITLTFEESDDDRKLRLHRRLLEKAVGAAAEWYEKELINSTSASDARGYLRGRGINGDTVRKFHLGWAPENNDVTKSIDVSKEIAIESGISLARDRGLCDKLQSRIIFPINDSGGRAISLAGRILPGSESPAKYMNFAETPLYQKRRTLYGLDLAKGRIVGTNEVVVCEGYMDVIGFHLAGIENAVATCGVALTEEHVVMLGRFARKIVMAFDADGAGQDAIERMHQWESRHNITFRVATFPDGADPGSMVESGQEEELRKSIENAQPLLGWRLERLFISSNLSTPEDRVAVADLAMEMVLEHPDRRVARQYVSLVAERCRVDVGPLRNRVSPNNKRILLPTRSDRSVIKVASHPDLEVEAIRLAVHDPEKVVDWFSPELFSDPMLKTCGELLLEFETLSQIETIEDPDIRSTLVLINSEENPELEDVSQIKILLLLAASERARRILDLTPEEEGKILRLETEISQGEDSGIESLMDWINKSNLADQVESEVPAIIDDSKEVDDGDLF